MMFSDFESLANIVSSIAPREAADVENSTTVDSIIAQIHTILASVHENPSAYPSDWVAGIRNWSVVL